jgi:hypothetical protein
MFDRSNFYDELKQNPALLTRLNTIVNGEVGRGAPLETRILYLETIFNRAQARGQSLAEVTRSVDGRYNSDGSGKRGYYPSTTFVNGAPRSQNEQNAFNEQVLKPVLAGSDVSTQKLGFAATGNASAHVARNGVVTGRYTRHASPGGRAGDPGVETYVQEGRLDNIDRLNRYASGGSIPTPPADIPMTDAQYQSAQPYTRDIQRAYPGYQPPTQVGVEGGAAGERVPLPYARGQSASGTASLAPTGAPPLKTVGEPPGKGLFDAVRRAFRPQDSGGGLGTAIASTMGPTGGMPGLINPGSEEGGIYGSMGLTRDLGRTFARPPAPAPARPVAKSRPPDQTTPGNPQRGPVPPRPDLGGITADETQRVTPPDLGGITADETQRGLMPFNPASLTVSGVPTGAFDVKQFMVPEQPSLLARTTSYFDRNPPMWAAPEEAGLLAAQTQPPNPPRRASPNPEPAPLSWPTTNAPPVNPPYAPTTTGQQMGGLSPFGTTAPQSGFASTSLLPFDQWPPVGWGWAGPASFNFGAWG